MHVSELSPRCERHGKGTDPAGYTSLLPKFNLGKQNIHSVYICVSLSSKMTVNPEPSVPSMQTAVPGPLTNTTKSEIDDLRPLVWST